VRAAASGLSCRTTLAVVGLVALVLLCTSCRRTEPLPSDAVVVVVEAAPRSIDPRFATSDYDAKLSRLVFAALVQTDTADGEPTLDLAASVVPESPTRYVVTVRDDARFHDGAPVTSADVVYTYGSLADVGSPYAGNLDGVTVAALDDRTVAFTLDEPFAPFLLELDLGIVPQHLLAETGTFGDRDPVGAGPWRFVRTDADGTTLLEAFDEGHAPPTHLRHVAFRVVPDDTTRLLALLAGSVDLAQNATPQTLLPVVARDPELVIETSPSFKYSYIVFNLDVPPLDDIHVRRAIALGIDREEIIAHRLGGAATLSTGLLPPHHWAWSAARSWPYDPAAAIAELDAGGYAPDAEGCRVRIEYKTSANRFYRGIAALIAAQLGEIGVCIDLQSWEWGTFFGDVKSGNFEMASLQWTSVVDPDLFAWIFHSENIPTAENTSAGGNRGRYRNDRVDALLDEGARTLDRDARRAIYAEVQQILADELPYVSLWHEDNVVVRRATLEGYTPVPTARFAGLVNARWATAR